MPRSSFRDFKFQDHHLGISSVEIVNWKLESRDLKCQDRLLGTLSAAIVDWGFQVSSR